MVDPFIPSTFNDWADYYDASVLNDEFPFTGYVTLLTRMHVLASPKRNLRILDLGAGTGTLAMTFALLGCRVVGTDFSPEMLNKARQKVPKAQFFLHDLRDPLPAEIEGTFDRILSSYVFHHFPLEEKVRILASLRYHLAVGGFFLLGDISFPDRIALESMKKECGEAWEEEYYWVAEEALPALSLAGFNVQYEQVSPCAGIYTLKPRVVEHQAG